MSYRDSERYAQLLDDCDLIEVDDKHLVEVEYYPLYRRMRRFVNFLTAGCNLKRLLSKRSKEQLDRLIASARLQLEILCLYGGRSKDSDFLRVGEELEKVAHEVRGRSRSGRSFKELHARYVAA